MSFALLFHYLMLNMFRMLVHPSSGACDLLWIYFMCCIAVLASYNAAPHNRYQPHPAEPEQHTKCSNTAIVLLKMGIMMPETC